MICDTNKFNIIKDSHHQKSDIWIFLKFLIQSSVQRQGVNDYASTMLHKLRAAQKMCRQLLQLVPVRWHQKETPWSISWQVVPRDYGEVRREVLMRWRYLLTYVNDLVGYICSLFKISCLHKRKSTMHICILHYT